MRGITKLPVTNILRRIYPGQTTQRVMMISTPKKHKENSDLGEVILPMNKNIEPAIAVFNRPQLPPFLGPLVLLSVIEIGSGDDKWKLDGI